MSVDLQAFPEELHLALLQSIPDGICFAGANGRVHFWNTAAEEITGFSAPEVLSARGSEATVSFRKHDGSPVDPDHAVARQNAFVQHKDGHQLPVDMRQVIVGEPGGPWFGILSLFTEIEAAGIREAVSSPADPMEHLVRMLERAGHERVGVLIVQIDEFEQTSGRLGPEAAEKVLGMVERTILGCLDEGDASGRVAVGQVLVILGAASHRDPAAWAERVRSLIKAAQLQWWGSRVRVTVTIGASFATHRGSAAAVLQNAKDASQAGVEQGGDQIVWV